MRDVDAVSAPRGIVVPGAAKADPDTGPSPRRHYPMSEGDVQRIWSGTRVLTRTQTDTDRVGPTVYAARETDPADEPMVVSPEPIETPVHAIIRRDGPSVVTTGDEPAAPFPVVVLTGRKNDQNQPTALARRRTNGGGPNIILVDDARDRLPTGVAARQHDSLHDGPTVIATNPLDDVDRPVVKYRGRQLND